MKRALAVSTRPVCSRLPVRIENGLLNDAPRTQRGEVAGTPTEVLLVDVPIVVASRAAGPTNSRRCGRHSPHRHLECQLTVHRVGELLKAVPLPPVLPRQDLHRRFYAAEDHHSWTGICHDLAQDLIRNSLHYVLAALAFSRTFALNFSAFITNRSCVPLLITSTPSCASTSKTSLLPSTSTSFTLATTSNPGGVAAEWLTFM